MRYFGVFVWLWLLVGCPAGGDDDSGAADDDSGALDDDDSTGDDDDVADDDSSGDDDTTAGDDDTTSDDDTTAGDDDDTTEPFDGIQRIVVAGDSWSTGSVQPLIDDLADRGHGDTEVAWETTAIAGSMVTEWVSNHDGKLDALDAALDGVDPAGPPAEILLIYLGGNDYHHELLDGLGPFHDLAMQALIDDIATDLQTLVLYALAGRPQLHVVLVDYSYLHYPWFTTLFGMDLDVDDTLEYNQGLTAIGRRKLDLADAHDRVHYVHNFGILQHTLGVPVTPPFTLPLVDYPPGFFDPPSAAPDYDPYPGGVRRADIDPAVIPPESLPGPVPGFDDGVHPSAAGWSVLSDHLFDQGLERLLQGLDWS